MFAGAGGPSEIPLLQVKMAELWTSQFRKADEQDTPPARASLLDLRRAQYRLLTRLVRSPELIGYSCAGTPPPHFVGRLNRRTSLQKWTYIADDLYGWAR